MKRITNFLLVAVFMFTTSAIFGQTKLSGTVVDNSNMPLPGAGVVVKGTTNGTATDFDGNFTLSVDNATGTIEVSFVGFETKSVKFTGTKNFGKIVLNPSAESLEEVIVTGVVDIAKERQTPVAVSTIKASEIIEKLGTKEFPEILNRTPSVYATKSGGGFGDARINIRGFDQRNTAVMINGMPVNDMENGWVYWSNWAGLSDVTSAMQVQRGLGSSKLAISSVGGTINVLTRTSDQKEGGSISTTMGGDNYQKYVASYSTGLMDNGVSASILFSRTTGDGYTDGTAFEGHNYFIGLGYKASDKNSFMFTFTGAPQWHNQHSRAIEIWRYQDYGTDEEPYTKFNDAYGFLNGKEYSMRKNFYHKPVMSLNWDWKISDNSDLSTILYGSWGRGGGTGPIGRINGIRDFDYRLRDANGHLRLDDIVKFNSGGTVADWGAARTSTVNTNSNGMSRRSSMNSHNWYGVISNFHNKVNENFSWDLGIDARTYEGLHYRTVEDLLGASSYLDNTDKNNPNRTITKLVEAKPSWNPWANIKDQEKIEYNNDGGVRWLGAFGQAEYKNDYISLFLQAGVSNQSFQRIDYFNLGAYNGTEQKSDWESLMGGNIKGGMNYNINESHNVFVNAGYYSKQPLFNAVYPNFNNNNVNEGLTNEKIVGLEFGYGFKTAKYRANLNLYRTSWKDRFLRKTYTGQDGYTNFSGIEQIHTGIEFESSMKFGKLTFEGMFSIGNWEYKGDVTGTEFDANNNVIGESGRTFYLDGVKVGDAAQTSLRLGLNYEIVTGLKVDLSQVYYENLYAAIDTESFTKADHLGSLELPGYSLIDLGLSYKWLLKNDNSLNFRVNVNNLADELYISESETNVHAANFINPSKPALGTYESTGRLFTGVADANRVYWGFGRTWNFSLRYNF